MNIDAFDLSEYERQCADRVRSAAEIEAAKMTACSEARRKIDEMNREYLAKLTIGNINDA